MTDIETTADSPAFLMEAARVLNAAGSDYSTAAAALADSAWQKSSKALKDGEISEATADAVAGDAAALRLAGRLPGGYRVALAILKTRIEDPGEVPDLKTTKPGFAPQATAANGAPANDAADTAEDEAAKNVAAEADTRIRLYLLRALALGQKYKAQKKNPKKSESDPDMTKLRQDILTDVKFVFDRRPEWAVLNQAFWDPPQDTPADNSIADLSDVYSYAEDPAFKNYVDGKIEGKATPATAAPVDEGTPPVEAIPLEVEVAAPAEAKPAEAKPAEGE
jgi:hypothetical protein